jgi:CIC family chloride channel protein
MSAHQQRADAQANVGGIGELTPRFWALAVLTGIAAGFGAIVMMVLLHAVQHAAFSYHTGPYSTAAAARSALRRVLVVLGGGVVAGVGWFAIRRWLGGTGGSPTRAVWTGEGELSAPRTLASGALSEIVIGLGASIGRENAPQHAGAAAGAWLARRFSLPANQRLLLIACGAGAGVGSVYNVPLAGALFAAELYLGSITLANVVPALITSGIATVVGWIYLPRHVIYEIPTTAPPKASLLVWALLAGPLIGIAAAGWVKLVGWASDRRPTDRRLLYQAPLAFVPLAALAVPYPLLLGNGRDLAQFAFVGGGTLGQLAALAALKPIVTALCLRGGASGGLFTPTLSTGAVLGAFLGHIWSLLWPGTGAEAYAIAGAGAMLAAGMRAPLAGLAFTIELTGSVNASVVAILLALGGAMLMARRLDRRSIYSARLPAREDGRDPSAGGRLGPEGDRLGRDQRPAGAAGREATGVERPGGQLEAPVEPHQHLPPGAEVEHVEHRRRPP